MFPPLRVYSPESAFEQLKLTATQYIASAKLAGSKGQMRLPALFELYEEDFIKEGSEDTLNFVKNHLAPDQTKKHAKLLITA